jgi:hypothetical protein
MKVKSPGTYVLRVKETLTIVVDPQNGAGEEQTAIAVDGEELPSSGGTKPTYIFKDTTQPGNHFGALECSFAGAPDGAKFVVTFKGSVDGQAQLTIEKADTIHDVDLEFRVKTVADYNKI